MCSKVAVERASADVLDDLAKRGKPVVAEQQNRARPHLERPAVVLRERRHRFSDLHAVDGWTGTERAPVG